MAKKPKGVSTDMIEIIGTHSDDEENRSWRVTYPEEDGSRGSSDFGTCELAVEFALFIRLMMEIQKGRRLSVVVTDAYDWDEPSGGGHARPSRNTSVNAEGPGPA